MLYYFVFLGEKKLFDKKEINNISRNALDLGSWWEAYMIQSCKNQYFASGILLLRCKVFLTFTTTAAIVITVVMGALIAAVAIANIYIMTYISSSLLNITTFIGKYINCSHFINEKIETQ